MNHLETIDMNLNGTTTVLMVPGMRDHVPDHWQTLLQARLPKAASVPPIERDGLSRAARVAALEATLADIDGPVIVVAHSAGVMTTVHWAQRHDRRIVGALLATPPDFEAPMPDGYPTVDVMEQNGWLPCPRNPLPFPSIVAASRNDPLARFDRVAEMAGAWGSRLVDLGEVGHLNPGSGFGAWPLAESLIGDFL